MSPAAARAEAKRLLALSLHEGVISSERVSVVVAAISKKYSAHQLRPILRAYLTSVRREIARSEARIEHAGPLSASDASAIAAHFTKTLGRPISPVATRKDTLLAGFRVRVGDDVTDLTSALRLANLVKALS